MDLWINYVDQILIYATLALSLNLLLGYAGQVSVAHASFGAIGGYAMGYTSQHNHWNFLLGTLVGMVLAFVIGSIVALPALKLTVEYLILLTLAVSSVILGLLIATPSMGGTYGLINLPHPDLFGWHIRGPRDWVAPSLVGMLIVYGICHRIGESPMGRVLKGIREDPMSTQALGKNVFGYKVAVFGISSALAAFAGSMLSAWLQLATPGLFGFSFSLTIFAIVIFGGMGNLNGTILGAVVVVLIEPVLRRVIKMEASRASVVQLIIYGLALVVLMRVRPRGALPEGFSPWRWLRGERGAAKRVEMVEGWVPQGNIAVREHAGVESDPGGGETVDESERRRERSWHDAPIVLETAGVGKRFGGIVAANDLKIELRKGTITALVGPNGAGKTTVFNLLTGFIPPDGGSVKLNGEELVGPEPQSGRPQGSGQIVPGRSPVQPPVVPAERHDGRAAPGRREFLDARVLAQEGRVGRVADACQGARLAGFRGDGRVRRRAGRGTVVRPDQAGVARPSAGHRSRRAAARRARVGHRHEVGRHHARPHRGGARAGSHGLRRRAQPARGRPLRPITPTSWSSARSPRRAPSPS